MDTKLKKTHKLKNLIIALIVLIPALVLVCLYPKMEDAAINKKEKRITEWQQQKEEYEAENIVTESPELLTEPVDEAATQEQFYLQDNFVNYAMEASYYQYAMLLQDALGEEVFTDVLESHGWINDYYELTAATPYFAEYTHVFTESGEPKDTYMAVQGMDLPEEEIRKLLDGDALAADFESKLEEEGFLGTLVVEFDSFGKLSNIRMDVTKNVIYEPEIYPRAQESISQYEKNALYYHAYPENAVVNADGNYELGVQVCPKNFRAVYFIYQDNERFVSSDAGMSYEEQYGNPYEYEPYYSPYELYFATGAYWIVLAMLIFVALAALILPFFKKLETGWEKLFSLPAEVIALLIFGEIFLVIGMGGLMSITTVNELTTLIVTNKNEIELLGYQFSVDQCYGILRAVNFLGWALAFFLEYICVANLRQFFARPKYYFKHRFLGIVLIRWIGRKIKQLVNFVLDIDINEKLHSSIVKIVLANGVIAALLCCIWFAGALGVVIYSVVLYILLKKYGSKLQKQYQSILNATGQMAEGDLHITLEEDLGFFAPLGKELEGVQQGFAKAVAEEAKSQNMKSELITNVSHDLKTPLTAIITYVDLLKNPDITEEERKSYIETLDMKSQRLKVLIEDLFEVSKANSGNVKMNFLDVDIVKLMKEVRVEMSDKIEQSNLDFRFHLPEEKVILSLDGQRTYRIFENILSNAIKYAMPFTRVYVDMTERESEVEIVFKNMSAQELKMDADYLTERFVRGDSSRNSEGSGLGLAIAKSFTELQNGKFEISVDGDLFKVMIKFPK